MPIKAGCFAMRSISLRLFIAGALGLGTASSVCAQGLGYWSSLTSPSLNETVAVTRGASYAEWFTTGAPETGYYVLDSVQVKLASGSDPEALRISVHRPGSIYYLPGANVGVLGGPASVVDNVATYPSGTISLQPFHAYFLVLALRDNSNVASVELTRAASLFDAANNSRWTLVGGAHSNNGVDWARGGVPFNLAINATLIPEPSPLALCGLGGLLLLAGRKGVSSCY